MAQIRGMAFLGTARHVKHKHGLDTLARILRDAGPDTVQTFSRRINGLELYPYEAFVGLLHAVDKHLGTGDLEYCRVIGDVAARHDLETIFRVYAVKPSPENMIRGCTPIWGMYTSEAGYMEAIDVRPDNTVLRITGFRQMDPAHCRMMEAWMIAAMDVIGVDVLPGARERECMSTGGRYHEFWCRWQRRER